MTVVGTNETERNRTAQMSAGHVTCFLVSQEPMWQKVHACSVHVSYSTALYPQQRKRDEKKKVDYDGFHSSKPPHAAKDTHTTLSLSRKETEKE